MKFFPYRIQLGLTLKSDLIIYKVWLIKKLRAKSEKGKKEDLGTIQSGLALSWWQPLPLFVRHAFPFMESSIC